MEGSFRRGIGQTARGELSLLLGISIDVYPHFVCDRNIVLVVSERDRIVQYDTPADRESRQHGRTKEWMYTFVDLSPRSRRYSFIVIIIVHG